MIKARDKGGLGLGSIQPDVVGKSSFSPPYHTTLLRCGIGLRATTAGVGAIKLLVYFLSPKTCQFIKIWYPITMSKISLMNKIDQFLRLPPQVSPVRRLRIRIFTILLGALIPSAIFQVVVVWAVERKVLVLSSIAPLVALSFLLYLRNYHRLKIPGLSFGLFMEILLIEGIIQLGSALPLAWLAAIPAVMVFILGPRLASWLLALPYGITGLALYGALVYGNHYPIHTPLGHIERVFIPIAPAELYGYGLLILVLYVVALLFHNLTLSLYQETLSQRTILATLLKQKEEVLATQRSIFDALPIPIFLKGPDLRYTAVTPSYPALVGLQGLDFIGKRVDELFPQPFISTVVLKDQELLERGGVQVYETALPLGDGSERMVQLRRTLLRDPQGKTLGILGVIIDETDRFERERELKILLDGRRDALALIGHDLKGPIGSFRELLRTMDEEKTKVQEDFPIVIAELNKKMNALWNLISELVDWALIDQGLLDFTPRTFDLSELLDTLRGSFADGAERKGIYMETTYPPGLVAYGDPKLISALIRNLVSNALKFTKAGGTVAIRARRRGAIDPPEASQAAGGGIELEVSDTGIGLRADQIQTFLHQGRIPSRRGTEGETGTGLGLSLCHRHVQRHGGHWDIQGEEGKGSTFVIFLPDENTENRGLPQERTERLF